MTKHILGYENEAYYSKISDQIFGDNLLPMKNLIEEELEFIGNFQEREKTEELSNEFYNLEFLDKFIENITYLDNFNSSMKKTNQYETAQKFIDKYS